MSREVLSALGILVSTLASAQPSYRQSTCLEPQVVRSRDVTLALPTAPNGLLVVGITVLSDQVGVVMTDTLGNTFEPATPLSESTFGRRTQVWFANNAAGGEDTLTVSLDRDAELIIYLHEYVGFESSAVIEAASSSLGDGLEMISGPITTTTAPTLLFGYAVSHAQATNPPPSFTGRERCSNDLSADFVATTPGTWNAVFEQMPTGGWTSALVAFKGASTIAADAGAEPGDGGDLTLHFRSEARSCSATGGALGLWVVIALFRFGPSPRPSPPGGRGRFFARARS